MKSTITFTATVALDKGGSITVQADEVPIAGADMFDLVENMFGAARAVVGCAQLDAEANIGAGKPRPAS